MADSPHAHPEQWEVDHEGRVCVWCRANGKNSGVRNYSAVAAVGLLNLIQFLCTVHDIVPCSTQVAKSN